MKYMNNEGDVEALAEGAKSFAEKEARRLSIDWFGARDYEGLLINGMITCRRVSGKNRTSGTRVYSPHL